MEEKSKIQQRIEYLKKENRILKQFLRKINKMDLYELEYDYDIEDELIDYPIYFSMEEIIEQSLEDESDPESMKIKSNLLTYIRKTH